MEQECRYMLLYDVDQYGPEYLMYYKQFEKTGNEIEVYFATSDISLSGRKFFTVLKQRRNSSNEGWMNYKQYEVEEFQLMVEQI